MMSAETRLTVGRLEARPLLVMSMAVPPQASASALAALRERWQRWATDAQWQLPAGHQGQVLRRSAHHLWMAFSEPRQCLQAAFALNQLAETLNTQAGAAPLLKLRSAAMLARYFRGESEPILQDWHLTAELSALAAPGEVFLTADLRDHLANGIDADLEDLGPWAARRAEHLRLFRAHPRCGPRRDCWSVLGGDHRSGLAIMPFKADAPHALPWVIGELIAEGVIARLSQNVCVRVIARQSTSALRGCEGLAEIQRQLGADFVLSGRYRMRNRQLELTAELADTRTHALLWQGQLRGPLDELFQVQCGWLHELALGAAHATHQMQVGAALARPLPSLDSNGLMLASMSMGHSPASAGGGHGHEALGELTVRHPHLAQPKAWLALWHALKVVKCCSGDSGRDLRLARELAQRALQAEPRHALALAVEGYIQCQLLGQPDSAQRCLTSAIEANPSEPMAWLFKALCSAGWDDGAWAVTEAGFGYALSPIDPLQYFFDLLMANALLANHQQHQAIAYGRQSLRACKGHVPTLRLLLTAHAELGQLHDGQETLDKLRAEAPDLSVSSYLAMGSADSPMRQRIARAMRQLGLPES